jgi:hypothetical protein
MLITVWEKPFLLYPCWIGINIDTYLLVPIGIIEKYSYSCFQKYLQALLCVRSLAST